MERSFQRFTTFYGSQHSGRKLMWIFQMSKGELVTSCFKNRYTLQVCHSHKKDIYVSCFQIMKCSASSASYGLFHLPSSIYVCDVKFNFLMHWTSEENYHFFRVTLTLTEIHCIKIFGDRWATCTVLLIKHIIKTKGCCIRILENAVKSLSVLYHESQTRLTLHHTQKVVYRDSEHSVAIHSLFFQSWFWCSVFELVLH